MIKFAINDAKSKNLSNVEFICSSLEDFKFKNHFDGVVCMGFFDYIKNSQQAIEKF